MQTNRKSFGTFKNDRYVQMAVMDEWPLWQVLLYNTGRKFFILLYFVFFFSLPLQTECVSSNQPLTFTYFPRKYLSFPCFTTIHQLFLNRTKMSTFLPKNCATQTHFTIVVMVFT